MNIDKLEKRFSDPNYMKSIFYMPWIGGAFLLASIAVLLFSPHIHKRIINPYQQITTKTEAIEVTTEYEKHLKSVLIEVTKTAKDGWTKFIETKTQNLFTVLFFIGAVIIGTYINNRQIHYLVMKLKKDS